MNFFIDWIKLWVPDTINLKNRNLRGKYLSYMKDLKLFKCYTVGMESRSSSRYTHITENYL